MVSLPLTEKPGTRIGHYKLLQQIGEGGCGVVYMADQEEPVRRRVALKVIKLGMDTRQVVARFEAERQALALMDHPNIAKVLDAGATDAGRPYFVMELVRGIRITDYCDQNNLPTAQRLKLFTQVCQAIQHAHQKGIIHRDIKPSNILVTMHDGVPVPMVIDFGIAKATTGQRLTDKTLFTAFEQFMGTPAYMSPEQAEMSGLDIDTRSDIYALGVLLYELLTGKTPFDAKELMAAGLDEMRRTIREQEPARPSTRLSTMLDADLTTVARHRQAEPGKLSSLIRGDLDWIVMKALEKDRTRRYETANGLAMDIQRYLSDELVVARPPSKFYRFQKLARRNKIAVAAVVAVLGALVIGLVISTFSLLREQRATEKALAAVEATKLESGKRQALADFFNQTLVRVSSQLAQGQDQAMLKTWKDAMDQTTARVATDFKDRPAVEAEVRALLAMVYSELGDLDKVEAMAREGIRLAELADGRESKVAVKLLEPLGYALMLRGDLEAAEAVGTNFMAQAKKVFSETSLEFSDSLNDLGLVRWQRGDLAGAEVLFHRARGVATNLPGEAARNDVATATVNLGLVQWEQGRLNEAERNLSEALDLSRTLFGNHPRTGFPCKNLALVLRDPGKLAGAEKLFREALVLLPPNHPDAARTWPQLAVTLRRRAAVSGDPASLHDALKMNPTDPPTVDALAAAFAESNLIPVSTPAATPARWRFSFTPPASNWFAADFTDTAWPVASVVSGFPTYSARSEKAITPHTNLWLRREFDLPKVPVGKVVLRLNRSHDAQIFLNGALAGATTDWTDAAVLVPCSEAAQATLKLGRNVLALHCEQVDGGTNIGVEIFLSPDFSLGRKQLLEEFNRLIQQEPERAELYASRANVFARQGRWSEAGADLTRAITLAPQTVGYWYQFAPLLVETGDLPGYGRHCRDALGRFTKPASPTQAAQVAALALLRLVEGDELTAALKLADRAAAAQYPDNGLAWRQLVKGLAEHRQGRFASAIEWLDKAWASAARPDLPGWNHERERNRAAAAQFVLAMAHHRLARTAQAQAALSKGIENLQTQLPKLDSGDIGREWPDWLIAHALMREAKELIEGKAGGGPGKP